MCRDACADVDCDTGDLVVDELAFACVQSRTDLKPELAKVILRLRGRSVLRGSAVENGKEAVADCIDFAPAVATEQPANERVMAPR